jgi:hypothetical protein
MSREPFPQVESPSLVTFARLAEEYCLTIERREQIADAGFLPAIHSLLPRLYSAALALPDTDILFPDTDDIDGDADYEPPDRNPDRASHDEWREIYRSLEQLIGSRNYYREVFDPYEPVTEKEVTGSIADDLTDIYRDLRTGLAAWKRGDSRAALWEWRFPFETHWGEHATSALRAIHVICSTYDGSWPSGAELPKDAR